MSKIIDFVVKNKNKLLVFGGLALECIIGNISTVRATIKAKEAIEKKKDELHTNKLTKKEFFETTWKYALTPIAINAGAIGMVTYGFNGTLKEKTLISIAYTAAANTAAKEAADFRRYRSVVADKIGVEKEKEISNQISDKKQMNNYVVSEDAKIKWYEPISGRYFTSTWHDITKAVDSLNAKARTACTSVITLSDLYDAWGLERTAISDSLVWDVSRGDFIDISDDAAIDDNHQPYGVIKYYNMPVGYDL